MSLGACALTPEGTLLLSDSTKLIVEARTGRFLYSERDARKSMPLPSIVGALFVAAEPGYEWAGAWRYDYVIPRGIAPEPPRSLAEARDTLVGLARDCVAWAVAECARRPGAVPGAGPPYYLTTMPAAGRITEERIES